MCWYFDQLNYASQKQDNDLQSGTEAEDGWLWAMQIKEDKNTNDVIISEKQAKKQMQDSDPRQKFLKWLSQEIEGSKGNPKVVETRLATSLPNT